MRGARRGFIAAFALFALAGCEAMAPPPTPVVPPFQVTETGAGFSPGTVGYPVRFFEGERPDGSLRIATRSIRVYAASGARLGRVRAASDAFVLERRDGSDVCTFELSDESDVMRCDGAEWRLMAQQPDGSTVLIAPDGQRVLVHGDADAAHALLESGVRVEATRSGSRVHIGAGPWQRIAVDVTNALDARGLVLREVVRSSASTDGELLGAGAAWMHHHRQRARVRSLPNTADQNAPPSLVTTGSGSSAATAEGSAASPGR